jgi:hypothetical protein
MAEAKKQASFAKSSSKTYSLVELVRAPTTLADRGPENTIFAFPIVALIELLLSIGVTVVLLFMSFLINAPLEEIANPNVTTDPAKAPWYFMGLQEMLEHGHPTLMAVIFPTIMVLFILAIPYLDNSREGAGRWFTSERGKRVTGYTALYALIIMPLYILLDNAFPLREILRGVVPDFIVQMLIPGVIMALIVLLPLIILQRYHPNAREVMICMFTLLIVSAVIFTLTGFLLRGPGFELYLPWNIPGGYNPFDNL